MTQTTTPSNAELAVHMQKIAFAVEEIVTEVKRHNDKLNALAAAVGEMSDAVCRLVIELETPRRQRMQQIADADGPHE